MTKTLIERLEALEADRFNFGTVMGQLDQIMKAIGIDLEPATEATQTNITYREAQELKNSKISLGRDKNVTGTGTSFIIYDTSDATYFSGFDRTTICDSFSRYDAEEYTREEVEAFGVLFFKPVLTGFPDIKVYDVETGNLAFIYDWK